MRLIPVFSNPTLRVHYESNFCEIGSSETGDLKLKVRLPDDFTANHLILVLKMKQGENFVGPNLLLFVKVIKQSDNMNEVSSFAIEQDDGLQQNPNSMDRDLKMIKQGVDVYNEQ